MTKNTPRIFNNGSSMKIITADDHGLIREGLRAMLNRMDEQLEFVEAYDGKSLHAQLAQHPDADLLLLDVQLPDCNGLTLLSEITQLYPRLPVVMVSGDYDRETVTLAIDRGASGFLPKISLNEVLVSAIRLVMAGGIYIPPEAIKGTATPAVRLAASERVPAPVSPLTAATPFSPADLSTPASSAATSPHAAAIAACLGNQNVQALGLTERQLDVLDLLLQGMSNKQICRVLDLAEATVKVHVRAILRAFKADSRTEVVVAASRMGWKAPHQK